MSAWVVFPENALNPFGASRGGVPEGLFCFGGSR